VTEAIACLEAIQAASDWGMGRIHIESDCTNLISTPKGFKYDLAREGVLFWEIRSFASVNFISFKIAYCSFFEKWQFITSRFDISYCPRM
jgi:hypothetical protein